MGGTSDISTPADITDSPESETSEIHYCAPDNNQVTQLNNYPLLSPDVLILAYK